MEILARAFDIVLPRQRKPKFCMLSALSNRCYYAAQNGDKPDEFVTFRRKSKKVKSVINSVRTSPYPIRENRKKMDHYCSVTVPSIMLPSREVYRRAVMRENARKNHAGSSAEDDATLVHTNASVNNSISNGGGAGRGPVDHSDDSNDSGLFSTTLEGSLLGDNDGDDGGGLVNKTK